MLLDTIHSPIVIFNINNFNVDQALFSDAMKNSFFDLPWDYYDMRKMQIDFLQRTVSKPALAAIPATTMVDYYRGQLKLADLDSILSNLTPDQRSHFNLIKPYRKRTIAEFILNFKDMWLVERVPASQFSQIEAKIDAIDKLDYRRFPRIFQESDHRAVETDLFKQLLTELATIVQTNHPTIKKLNIVTHHTYVEATHDQAGDNSPEGIHQDGFDYIVSALVIERKNISGGVSRIYGADKKTCMLATQLSAGQGILQPDRGTNLWHNVTPIAVLPEYDIGFRSSIGFDINLMQ